MNEDGRKLFAGTIEAADPRELVIKWSAFLATAERLSEPGCRFDLSKSPAFLSPHRL
jgi:hypothetical protein